MNLERDFHMAIGEGEANYADNSRLQMMMGMDEKMAVMNGGNIYIANSTPPSVVKLYQDQFQKDMSLFLELRHQELVHGGWILLTFLGRKTEDVFNGEPSHLLTLLAQAFQSLVNEGLVEKEKLESFNLPIYGPSINEVKAVVTRNGFFGMEHIELFESNWDPYVDDSEDDSTRPRSAPSGANVAKSIRAVLEVLLTNHFGEYVLDELFERYAQIVERYLAKEKGKYSLIVLSLYKRGA